jgi:hypothetical protein
MDIEKIRKLKCKCSTDEMLMGLKVMSRSRSRGQTKIFNFYEFASIVGLCDVTLRKLLHENKILPTYVCGDRYYFDEKDIMEFINIREGMS